MKKAILPAGAILAATTATALAHTGTLAEHSSFSAGFMHPLTGLDHLLAIVLAGVFAAALGGKYRIALPLVFLAAMGAGFAVALQTGSIPFVEGAILLSLVALGFAVSGVIRPGAAISLAMVGGFAFAHGAAHGAELGGASALTFGAGFLAATAAVLAAGCIAGERIQAGAFPLASKVAGFLAVGASMFLALN
ncbi:HupE/UreJ family protein [Fulvimarina sp. MAC3]|uniref:HupE/UreJ family protein n=1 Tax=Fulvimarina sp. MAC3 TaxID=3148887 RepID=UPI0031FD8430